MKISLKLFLLFSILVVVTAGCTNGKSRGSALFSDASRNDNGSGTQPQALNVVLANSEGYYNKTGFCKIVDKKDFSKIYHNTCTSNLPVCNINGTLDVVDKKFSYLGGGELAIPDFIIDKFKTSTTDSITVSPFEAASIIEGLCFASLDNSLKTGKTYGEPLLIMSADTMHKVAFKGMGISSKFSVIKVYLVIKKLEAVGLTKCEDASMIKSTMHVFGKLNDQTEVCRPVTVKIDDEVVLEHH